MPESSWRAGRRRSALTMSRAPGVALLAVIAVALAACGGDDNSAAGGATGASSGGTPAGDVQLGLVTAGTTQNVFVQLNAGGEEAARQAGVKLTQQAPPQINPEQEVQMFNGLARKTKDGIAYMTTAPDVFARPTKSAVDAGVPVVSMDAAPLPSSGVETFVGNDNYTLGQSVAKELIKDIPPDAKGEVVIGIDIPGLGLLEARVKGMIDVLKKERPNVTIVGPLNAGAEPADNYNRTSAMVKAHPHALAFLQPGAQGAVSMQQITQQTGKHYLFGGCDVDPTSLGAVKSGAVKVLGDPWHWVKGYVATRLLAEHAVKGTDIPKGWWNTGSGVVTSANVDQIVAREKSNAARYAFFKAEIDKQFASPPIKPISQAT
jgi:ribose transport system substrate-binding protein